MAAGNRNITVVSLRDVNIHLRKILPLLLCKKLYDDKKSDDDGTTYLNLIIDEAHNILSESSSRESEQWERLQARNLRRNYQRRAKIWCVPYPRKPEARRHFTDDHLAIT